MRFLQSAMIAAVCLVWPMAVSGAQGRPKTGAYQLHFPDRVEKLIEAMKGSPAAGADAAPASGPPQAPSSPYVRLGKVPVVKLGPQKPVSREEAVHIRRLIASLAEIDSGDYGLSPTYSGTVFHVLPGLEGPAALHLTPARPNSSPALRELIVLGPRALPFLLAALDDRTPTRLTVRHRNWGAESIGFAFGIWRNPVSAAEQKALASPPKSLWGVTPLPAGLVPIPAPPGKPWDTSLAYTATVGDVCFVEIGQIVARPYAAIGGAASISIDSPARDPILAAEVRAIWSSKRPAQHLLDSLLLDYSTQGIFNGRDLGGWGLGSDLQVEAAMRLLYYFPHASAPLIAVRLGGLDVKARSGGEDWILREVSNGVSTNRFIQAVAWCKEPAIRSAVLGIFQRTTDPEILVSALSGIGRENAALVRSRVLAFLDHRPPYVGRALEDEIKLLMAYARWGATGDVKAVFKRYLDNDSVERCRNVCSALSEARPAWDLELLAPLLSDQRPEGGTYSVDPKQSEPRLPIRVCDQAAETVARSHPELSFKLSGTHEDLDRQIAAMRARISTGER